MSIILSHILYYRDYYRISVFHPLSRVFHSMRLPDELNLNNNVYKELLLSLCDYLCDELYVVEQLEFRSLCQRLMEQIQQFRIRYQWGLFEIRYYGRIHRSVRVFCLTSHSFIQRKKIDTKKFDDKNNSFFVVIYFTQNTYDI